MSDNSVYATPKLVTDINECYFYHSMDIPGYGFVKGVFDLRQGVDKYLGNVDFNGKRVLEMGTASGFLCFHMERRGADVVGYDLSEVAYDQSENNIWDIVPLYNCDYEQWRKERREVARGLNNAFWFGHRVFNSNAKMVYGSVYTIPREIGMVDVSTFGCILLHVRDPFLALQNALRLTKETVIITDGLPGRLEVILEVILGMLHFPVKLRDSFHSPRMTFYPTPREPERVDTWWRLSPEILKRMLAILGFEDTTVNFHWQIFENGKKVRLYTIVGRRTKEYYSY